MLLDLEKGIRDGVGRLRSGAPTVGYLRVLGSMLNLLVGLRPGGGIEALGQWRDSLGKVGMTSSEVSDARFVFKHWEDFVALRPRLTRAIEWYSFEEFERVVSRR